MIVRAAAQGDALIGHNVVLATLNHDLDPDLRATTRPQPAVIGKKPAPGLVAQPAL